MNTLHACKLGYSFDLQRLTTEIISLLIASSIAWWSMNNWLQFFPGELKSALFTKCASVSIPK
jgi:hypothetical protein